MFGLSTKAIIITGVAAFAAGFLVGMNATATVYEKMIVPGRETRAEERAKSACLETSAALSQAAAAEAVAGEAARRSAAIAAAIGAYQSAVVDDQAATAERLQTLEEENKRYASELNASGKSCPLDDDSMRFLGGVPG